MVSPRRRPSMVTTRCASSTEGNGRSTKAFRKLKIAELAPIPNPSASTAIAAYPGLLENSRRANRMSFQSIGHLSY